MSLCKYMLKDVCRCVQGKVECPFTFSSTYFNQLFHYLQLGPRPENAEPFTLKRCNESSIPMINEIKQFVLLLTYHEQILLCHSQPMNLYSTVVLELLIQEFLARQLFSLFPMGKRIVVRELNSNPINYIITN